jgi:acetyl esterase/lipase
VTTSSLPLPGRLGDPAATLETDPRADPRIIKLLELTGGLAPGLAPVDADATYEACLDYCRSFEDAAALANPEMLAAMPAFETVTCSETTISGVDGNEITLFLHKPANADGPVPCVVHTHGGGMVMMSANDPGFIRLRSSIASRGLLVVGVEFRNGGGRLGNHPFPAGLNDCASAVRWVHAQRDALGVQSITVSGESGGGNLCLATALKANQEGWIGEIDGVFAMCPYIFGDYADPPPHLLSLKENNGYMLDRDMMGALAKVYDPTGDFRNDPLAWPYHAPPQALKGLPPHVISVNELDPLRDEGLAYYRKLIAAGVPAIGRTSHGTPHAGDQSFPDAIPEVYEDLVGAIAGFAGSL